jgi:hypothetical protein
VKIEKEEMYYGVNVLKLVTSCNIKYFHNLSYHSITKLLYLSINTSQENFRLNLQRTKTRGLYSEFLEQNIQVLTALTSLARASNNHY